MTAQIETPSGKGAGDENFPVGSLLLPARLRPHVAVFYAFARAADDIADSPGLAPADKIARLEAFASALTGAEGAPAGLDKAVRLRASLAETGVPAVHALDLLDAFRQDATKTRYADWGELMDYCARSANPVGRYLLDLHGEDRAGWPAADALCTVLQVLNHLQDCARDLAELDRCYLPLDWLGEVGRLRQPAADPVVRRTLDLCLQRCAELLEVAAGLPGRLRSRRLAMESAVILALARRLAARLSRGDPLAGRVALSRLDFVAATGRGVWAGLFPARPLPPARAVA